MANVLFNVSIVITEEELPQIAQAMCESLYHYEKIYSYVLYKLKDAGYKINYMVAENDKYNCLSVKKAITNMLSSIVNHDGEKNIISYDQPPIEILIEVLQPLVHKLAKEQHERWRNLEYEDLVQMCNYIICDLRHKGYYIHKRLIRKAYMNYVLMQLRPHKDEPQILSIYQTFVGDADLEKLTIGDTIVDESYEIDEEEAYRRYVIDKVFDEVKQIVIELIGPRRFDQLYRDYAMKHTTPQTRKTMQTVKSHLINLGISMKEFNDKYYG